MSGTHWIVEGRIDPRWPVNTRGNVGEVFPEVLTPLSYELGVLPGERAWRDSYARLGVLRPGDFSSDDPVIIGLYGGYAYLNMSYLRILGVRAPGSSPEAIDLALFGESDAPPYEARSGDRSLVASMKILRTVLGALGQRESPAIVEESFRTAEAYGRGRPPLDAPDEALLDHLMAMPQPFEIVFRNHMTSTALASIVSGILGDACVAAGEPGLVTHLLGTAGDVRSASYSRTLAAIADLVRSSAPLSEAFDAGVTGLLDRIANEPWAAEFVVRFAEFIAEHGHRGPNDWELSGRTWENTPELALLAVDRMRIATEGLVVEHDPVAEQRRRDAAIAKVRPAVARIDRLNFDRAVRAAPVWSRAREATRDRAVRLTSSAKQVYRELVRRGAERGGDHDPVSVALLSPSTELRAYLAEPAGSLGVIAERRALYDRFAAVSPRFFITSQAEVPTIEELESERSASGRTPVADRGAVLSGKSGCAGIARGRVRVVLDPGAADELEPGEILVAPITDPAWTPLFLPAAGVVVDVGALMSHAVIVARELEIPCVVSVDGATRRLVDGMLVEVDGTAGTVTVLEV
ncbi:MAG: PEP-utilizing enzyme [Ilumatobacteraceae bacterium]